MEMEALFGAEAIPEGMEKVKGGLAQAHHPQDRHRHGQPWAYQQHQAQHQADGCSLFHRGPDRSTDQGHLASPAQFAAPHHRLGAQAAEQGLIGRIHQNPRQGGFADQLAGAQVGLAAQQRQGRQSRQGNGFKARPGNAKGVQFTRHGDGVGTESNIHIGAAGAG